MPFVQVLLLLGLLAYLLLVALENPGLIHLPLPLGRGEWLLPTGAVISLFLVIGSAYAALLLLPGLWQSGLRRRALVRERQLLEQRLAATLQARLGSLKTERTGQTASATEIKTETRTETRTETTGGPESAALTEGTSVES